MRRPPTFDIVLALILFAAGVAEVVAEPFEDDVVAGPVALNVVAMAAATLPLAWRRRFPLAVMLCVFGAIAARALVSEPLETYPPQLAALVASYSLAAYGTLRDTLVAAPAAILAIAVAIERGTGGDATPAPIATAVLHGGVWVVGRIAGRSAERDRRREADLRAAEERERERIARELHDSVAHSLAVIVMQAGGAQGVLERDPGAAARSLAAIERAARDGMGEMRRLLMLLAEDDEDLGPAPDLRRLDALVEQARDAGMDAVAEIGGTPRPLPDALGRSAYRILQEGLTNAIKHAGPCRVTLRVTYGDEALELEVADEGRGAGAGTDGAGRGLIGMRQRAQAHGGHLVAGPRAEGGGGFRVHAHLPLERA